VKILKDNELIGRVVRSTAGRDNGRFFIIMKIIDESYVEISDGDLRTEQKPKKKKIKHLYLTDIVIEEVKELVVQHEKVENATIRKFLQFKDFDKEV
jgi:ribosomal protein L14E/L6E/L27E